MDEFGRPVDRIAEEEGEQAAFGRPLYPPTEHERQPVGPRRAPPQTQDRPRSPPPFASYEPKSDAIVNIDLESARQKFGSQQPPQPEDDGGAGCCKCVVM